MTGLQLLLVGVPIYFFPVNLMSSTGEGLVSKNLFTLGYKFVQIGAHCIRSL